MRYLFKKLTVWTLCLAMAVGMLPGLARGAKAAAPDAGASAGIAWNKEKGYYEISSYEGLLAFADIVNSDGGNPSANAILLNDIDASASDNGSTWTPIGTTSNPYTGTFDGQGKIVRGLTTSNDRANYVGLFGWVVEGGRVENVGLVEGSITGNYCVGGVVGINAGTVLNCYNTSEVNGNDIVGGVIGFIVGAVSNCHNSGTVTGKIERTGGVVGYSLQGTVSNCYNTGDVEGKDLVGGVAGVNDSGTVSNCYYDRNVCVIKGAADANNWKAIGEGSGTNVTGLTTAEMTGTDALNKMEFYYGSGEESPWLVKANDEFYSYYPHLKGFNMDKSGNQLDAKGIEIKDWSSRILKDGAREISNYDELKRFAAEVNGDGNNNPNPVLCGILLNDISASASANGNPWTPIGTESQPYTGTFDGNGKKITGLTIEDTSKDYVGLFGYVGSGGTVQNVALEGGTINGNRCVGGVVGFNAASGTVENCYNTGDVSGNNSVGGVVGVNSTGTVENCYNTGAVSGDSDDVGGVVGVNASSGTVKNCYNTGAVSGDSDDVGGVVGFNYRGTVTNCYNTGAVDGNNNVGGVVGFNAPGTVENCYNTGAVSGGGNRVGGVVGFNSNGEVENCYYDKCTCQVDKSIGNGSGTNVMGLTTAQMTGEGMIGSGKSMNFTWEAGKESPWLDMNDSASGDSIYWHYPHLKGFEYDNDKSEVNWPAKIEVTVKWDSYYNGAEQNPSMNGVLVVSGDTIIPDALNKMNIGYFHYDSVNGWGNVDDYSALGYYKMEFYEDSSSPAIAIKYFSVLETGDISVNHGDSASWKDAGTYTASVILAKYGNKIVSGEFEIMPADVTITAQDKEFTYTGEVQNWNQYDVEGLFGNDRITAVVTGSITYPNESPVTNKLESYKFTTGDAGNYKVTIKNGTLTMTQARIPITITAASQEWVYDGQAHENAEVTITSGALLTGDELVASATGSITSVSDNKEGNNPVAAGYKIMHGDKDVTENYVITTVAGTLKVSSKTITITADSASKEYDGTALTKNSYTNTALVIGDTIESVTITGSQSATGKSDNVPSAAVIKNATGEDVSSCYDITYINGSLEVTKKALTITADSASKEYDKTELTKDSYTFAGLANGDAIKSVTIAGSQIMKGSSDNVPSKAVIVNAKGEDVTSSYDITYKNGTLTVTAPNAPSLDDDQKPFPKNDLKEDGKDQILVLDPANLPEGYTIEYSTDGGKTWAPVPTGKESGEYTIEVFYKADENHTDFFGDTLKVMIQGVYNKTESDGDWTKGSGKTYTFRIKKAFNDEVCFDNFTGVLVDGKQAKAGENYTAVKGSTVITFAADYLETLSVGEHMIRVVFKDGEVLLPLKILEAVATPTPAVDATPVTGDTANPFLFVALILVSMAGAAVMIERRRHSTGI